MTNQEILTKAIRKAIDGGWKPKMYFTPRETQAFNGHTDKLPNDPAKSFVDWDYNKYIWQHDFAKSFFGTNEVCFSCGLEGKHDPYCAERTSYDEAWKYHLREMVGYDNPIDYLGEQL